MQASIVIPTTFRGPPDSGIGGYVAGAIAECFSKEASAGPEAAIEVTLRAPTPLDRPMGVVHGESNTLQVILGETLIADAAVVEWSLEVPEPPSYSAALAAPFIS